MNFTDVTIAELKLKKELYLRFGLSNPCWVLLLSFISSLIAAQLLWSIYVLWLERPIEVKWKYMKEKEDFIAEIDEDTSELELPVRHKRLTFVNLAKGRNSPKRVNKHILSPKIGELKKEVKPKNPFSLRLTIRPPKVMATSESMTEIIAFRSLP